MIENIPIPGINDFDKIFWKNCTKNIFSIKNIRIIGRISNSDNATQLDIDNLEIGSAVSINFHKINSDISIPFWYLDS